MTDSGHKKSFEYYSRAQLFAEMARCESCATKPCQAACPADCSPADFILAARTGTPQDIARAAAEILQGNPLGETCGVVCPDCFCMDACTRKSFDQPLNIPRIQASLVHLARESGLLPTLPLAEKRSERIAIIGAGPAGLAAAAILARSGLTVELFEQDSQTGGACNFIPQERLPRAAIESDVAFVQSCGDVKIHHGQTIEKPESLLHSGFHAVICAEGVYNVSSIGTIGEEHTTSFYNYLKESNSFNGRAKVAIVGGGAVAVDCALTARKRGADHVELFVRRGLSDMKLTASERELLLAHRIDITARARITRVAPSAGGSLSLTITRTQSIKDPVTGKESVHDSKGTEFTLEPFDLVISATGASANTAIPSVPGVFVAGDRVHGASTVVEAAASGKNAALAVLAYLENKQPDSLISLAGTRSAVKSRAKIKGVSRRPVPLNTDFFGIPVASPFFLSAAPATDGYSQMRKAYEAGWAGGVMKTAFDNIPIHIPAGYMFTFDGTTFANCDNVSGHPLDRVCAEIEKLRREFPDRLTMGSSGGPVTGNDEYDRKGWQSNTRKLQNAGASAVEYSLSCPQGGDGSEGNIVSQNAALTAKIIDWILEASDPNVPKLFKLTAAVTSPQVILKAVKEVLNRHPNKKAGVTLANSFPVLAFRERGTAQRWPYEGVVVGMSGQGALPISYYTLSQVHHLGVTISGNGGPMDHIAAAHFLALGARSVQFCSIAMKYGVEIIRDLEDGFSHLLAAHKMRSVAELIGAALPKPVTDFMELSPIKQIPTCDKELCTRCGNCTRCGYQAIAFDATTGYPVADPSKCVGCSFCVKMCFTGALALRQRNTIELAALKED